MSSGSRPRRGRARRAVQRNEATTAVSWYVGSPGGLFYPIAFVNSLDQMSLRAGQVMASAPRSSAGASGFGGRDIRPIRTLNLCSWKISPSVRWLIASRASAASVYGSRQSGQRLTGRQPSST